MFANLLPDELTAGVSGSTTGAQAVLETGNQSRELARASCPSYTLETMLPFICFSNLTSLAKLRPHPPNCIGLDGGGGKWVSGYVHRKSAHRTQIGPRYQSRLLQST